MPHKAQTSRTDVTVHPKTKRYLSDVIKVTSEAIGYPQVVTYKHREVYVVMDMWKKLHLKSDSLVVLSPPSIFNEYLDMIKETHQVSESISEPFSYLLAFVTCQNDLPQIIANIRKHAAEDPVVWFAFPKRTSKLSKDLSRDKGFDPIGQIGAN